YRLSASTAPERPPTQLALPDSPASSAAPAVATRPEAGERAGAATEGRSAGTRTRIDSALAAPLAGSIRSPRGAPSAPSGRVLEPPRSEPWQGDPLGVAPSEPEHEQKLVPGAGVPMREAPEGRDVAPEPLPTTEIIDPWARSSSQ